jgi:CheY-like chemotaxis protein
MSFRILHVDDDSDIREIVNFTLGLDPAFTVTSCAAGDDALAIAADCTPDLILCDVMMPGTDGPTVLARLRESPKTAQTPLIFMTARARAIDVEQFKTLGAVAVITKPFDPAKLADSVRTHLGSKLAEASSDFVQRLRSDADALEVLREKLLNDPESSEILEGLKSFAHKLAGAAGVFNFQVVSCAASSLEEAVVDRRACSGPSGAVEDNLNALLECMRREGAFDPAASHAGGRPHCESRNQPQDGAGDRDDG